MTTILIVDDRAINRDALCALLDDYGYTVLEAEDGALALELARAHKIDLIISDIAMPRMDGLTLAKQLYLDANLKKIPLIFYTATYKAAEAYKMASSSNVKHVITKPCHSEIILGTIQGVLDANPVLFNQKSLPSKQNQELMKKEKFDNINLRLINLIEISLDMSLEQDIEKLIGILCKGSRQLLNAYCAGIILCQSNDPKQYENFRVSQQGDLQSYPFLSENFPELLKKIFLDDQPMLIHSPMIDVEKIGLIDIPLPFSSILSLPLKTNNTFYGKIYFINKFNQTIFNLSDQRLMTTLSYKFAICYENLLLRQTIKKHAQELQEITDRLHLTLEAANLGVWSWAISDKKLILDKYACLLFGLDPKKPPRTIKALFESVIPEDRIRIHKILFGKEAKSNNDPIKFRIVGSDKTMRYFTLRAKTYYDADENPVRILGVYWDITEQVQAEEKFRAYQKQLAETIRSNSLGEMASSLAHEINQPLTAISAYVKGCVRRLENKNEVTPEIMDILIEASNQAERAGAVVHRIKNYVRQGELFYENIDINTIIAQAIHLITQEVQDLNLKILYTPTNDVFELRIDRIQIEQVILNLLRNAIEAMQEVKTPEPQITIQVNTQKESYLTVQIIDNGPGFSAQIADHLFDSYFTTKTQGMGLGLAICRSIIEAHSGQLSASQLATGGSCFQFDLPIKEKHLCSHNALNKEVS